MKKILVYIVIIAVTIIGFFLLLKKQELYSYKERGNELIRKIHKFEKVNHKLPNSISDFEVDTEMGEGPYYEKLNDTIFIVYFNIGFDDKLIFDSNKNDWK